MPVLPGTEDGQHRLQPQTGVELDPLPPTAPSQDVIDNHQTCNNNTSNRQPSPPSPPTTSTTANPGIVDATPTAKAVRLKLLSCCFGFLVAGLNDGSIGALLPYIIKEYKISTGSVGVLYATSFAGWAVAALVMPFAKAYAGLKGTLLLGTCLYIMAQALRVWLPPYPLFVISFFFASLAQAFQDAQANTFVSSISASHLWLGLIHAIYGLGLLVAPLVATALASNVPGRWATYYAFPLGVGALNVGLVLVAFFPVRGYMGKTKTRRSRVSNANRIEEASTRIGDTAETEQPLPGRLVQAKAEMIETLQVKVVWLISLFFFFYLGAAVTIGGWIVVFLTEVRYLPLASAGYVPTGYYGGLFLGRLILAGPTHTQLGGEHYTLTLCSVLIVALQLVIWLVDSAIATSVAVGFVGLLIGPFFAAAIQVASEIIPRKVRASALSLVFVVAQLGGSVFPALMGAVADQKGVGVLQPIVLALLAAMGVTWWFVPTIPRGRELEAN